MSSAGDLKFAIVVSAQGGEQARAELGAIGSAAAGATGKLQAMGEGGAAAAQKLGKSAEQAAQDNKAAIDLLDQMLAHVDPNLAARVTAARSQSKAMADALGHVGAAAQVSAGSIGKVGAESAKAANDAGAIGAATAKIIPINAAAQAASLSVGKIGAASAKAAGEVSTLGASAAKILPINSAAASAAQSIDALGGKAEGAAQASSKGFGMIGGAASALMPMISGVGAMLAGVFAVRETYNTLKELDNLNASLKTVTGSLENAKVASAFLQDFAYVTPYELKDVTEAFIRLRSLGLDATRDSLTAYGNVAAAMGKPLMQFIEAVADATTGEFERLKEFGIKASQQGESVTFTFQGVSTNVKKNADDIAAYLKGLGQVQFATGMADQMNTLGGQASNLSDAFHKLVDDLGNLGIRQALMRSFAGASDVLGDFRKHLNATFGDSLQAQIDAYELRLSELEKKRGDAFTLNKSIPLLGPVLFPESGIAGTEQSMRDMRRMLDDLRRQRAQQQAEEQGALNNMAGKGGSAATPAPYDYGGSAKTAYDDLFHRYESQYALPDGLLRAVAKAESGFNPGAVGDNGAQGLMQLMPPTAKSLGVANPYDPAQAIEGAAKYLADLLRQFGGDVTQAIAAYNAGPGAVRRVGGNLARLPAETQKYVPEVAKNLADYGNLHIDAAGQIAKQKALLEAQSAAQKAAIDLQDQAVQDGLKKQEGELKASLDARKISETEYYAQLAIVRNKSIDAEIKSRRDLEVLIREQAGQDSSDAAAQITAKSQIARIDQEINRLEAQRTAVMDEAKAALVKNAQALVDQYDKIGSAQRLLTQQTQILKAALAQDLITPDQYSRASQMISASQKAAGQFSGPTSALDQRFGGGGLHGGESGIANDAEVVNGVNNAFKATQDQIKTTDSAARDFGLTFTSAFENAIRAGNDFRDVLKGVLSDLQGIILRRGVTNVLLNAVTGSTGKDALPTFMGQETSDAFTNAVHGVGKSALEGIGSWLGFADGGSPPVGKASVVGERGPELFVPREAGYVIPNHVIQSIGGVAAALAALDDPAKRQFLLDGKVGGFFADGGVPPVGAASVVGERGPEIFRPFAPPSRPGTVNHFTGHLPAITQHFDFSQTGPAQGGVDLAAVEARIRQATADGARQGYALMLDDLRRNGPGRRLLK